MYYLDYNAEDGKILSVSSLDKVAKRFVIFVVNYNAQILLPHLSPAWTAVQICFPFPALPYDFVLQFLELIRFFDN